MRKNTTDSREGKERKGREWRERNEWECGCSLRKYERPLGVGSERKKCQDKCGSGSKGR